MSSSQILAGDPRVAVLVLAAVIDHNLDQSDARREDIEYVGGLITQFSEASDTIGLGRAVTAQTDAPMHADILSWWRLQGPFTGVALEGVTLREDLDDNANAVWQETGEQRDCDKGRSSTPRGGIRRLPGR